MFDSLISTLAPHLCYSCGRINAILCENCKYDISLEYFDGCLVCGQNKLDTQPCSSCSTPYSRSWCVGERSGVLRKIIDSYKFYNNYAAHRDLASLLSDRVGLLPRECVIVPVPTVSAHIRQRGYDHTLLVARRLAKLQGLKTESVLQRQTSTKQLGKSRKERLLQASQAFVVRRTLRDDVVYLLVDDVVTTGATLQYAAQVLKEAGAVDVWVAAIARQPLD